MIGIVIALVASVSWAVGSIFVRLGIDRVRPAVATFLSVVAGLFYVSIIALIMDAGAFLNLSFSTIVGFVIVGLLSFGAGRLLYYVAVGMIGVGRATALGAATPIVSSGLAVLFLGELMTLPLAIGTLAVVGGVGLIVTQPSGAKS